MIATRLPSEIAGTFGLWLLLVVAALIAYRRRARRPSARRLLAPAGLTLLLQAAHFGEELLTGFHRTSLPGSALARGRRRSSSPSISFGSVSGRWL